MFYLVFISMMSVYHLPMAWEWKSYYEHNLPLCIFLTPFKLKKVCEILSIIKQFFEFTEE